jgi:DNA-binding response OmpR family regulator
MRILVIDDDLDFCQLLKMLLEKSGHEVNFETTLKAGLLNIDECRPEVVFMDNLLPDGDGWPQGEIVQKKYPDMQVNLISAADKSFLRTNNLNQAIWEKPITITQLENYFKYLKFI